MTLPHLVVHRLINNISRQKIKWLIKMFLQSSNTLSQPPLGSNVGGENEGGTIETVAQRTCGKTPPWPCTLPHIETLQHHLDSTVCYQRCSHFHWWFASETGIRVVLNCILSCLPASVITEQMKKTKRRMCRSFSVYHVLCFSKPGILITSSHWNSLTNNCLPIGHH